MPHISDQAHYCFSLPILIPYFMIMYMSLHISS